MVFAQSFRVVSFQFESFQTGPRNLIIHEDKIAHTCFRAILPHWVLQLVEKFLDLGLAREVLNYFLTYHILNLSIILLLSLKIALILKIMRKYWSSMKSFEIH